MRRTKKFTEAQKVLGVKVATHQELYDRLFTIGYKWDGKTWFKPVTTTKKKASPVQIRLAGEELSCRAVISLIQEKLKVTDINLVKNRTGKEVRVYAVISPVK